MVWITQQSKKLLKLDYQTDKFTIKITKSKHLRQNAGDGLRPNHYHCVEIHQYSAQFGYILCEIDKPVHGSQRTWKPFSGT